MTDRQSDGDLRHDITVALSRVSYFHNIAGHGPGICPVCRGPATGTEMCPTCTTTHANLFGATCNHTFLWRA